MYLGFAKHLIRKWCVENYAFRKQWFSNSPKIKFSAR